MNICEVRSLKLKLESDISAEVSRLVKQFTDETGLPISSVGIDVIDVSRIGDEAGKYEIKSTYTSVGI